MKDILNKMYSITNMIFSAVLMLLVYWIAKAVWAKLTGRLPPGPTGLPILGYLPWIDSKQPHKVFEKLSEKYGKLFSVRIGSVTAIVMSDPLTIKKVFSMKETIARAPLFVTHGLMDGYGIISSDGLAWQEHRRFLLNFMRVHGMRSKNFKDQMEERIKLVTLELMQEIREFDSIDVTSLLTNCLGNSLNELVFGFKYPKDDSTWMWLQFLLKEGIKLVGIAGPLNFLPWLRFLPQYNRILAFLKDNQILTHKKYQEIISRSENNDNQSEPSNMTQAYLQEMKDMNSSYTTFSYKQLHHLAADIFGAGTETSVTVLTWYLLDLAMHQEVQERLRRYLMILEGQNSLKMENIEKYAYFQATLMESQRLRTILALGMPHGVNKDINIGEYVIPKGSMLIPFQWRIHHSPEYWKDPMKFIPERFLDDNGHLIQHDAFLPFQIGRRRCPGDEFAKMVILLFTSAILVKFRISIDPLSGSNPAEDPLCGFTIAPRPFKFLFERP